VPRSVSLSHSDLSLAHSVCEIRYDMAFLIYDRTGAVCHENKEHFPDLKILQASPSVTTFLAEPFYFAVEQTMSRAVCSKPRHDPKHFGESISPFFEIVLRQLEVPVLNRVGLRQLYFQTFAEPEEAASVVKTLKLQHGSADNNFGVANSTKEIILRWESTEHGAMLHLVTAPGSSAMPTVDIFQIEEGFGKTYRSALLIDVDFYTMAPVLRSQWNAAEWTAQSSHAIKKGIRSFLRQC